MGPAGAALRAARLVFASLAAMPTITDASDGAYKHDTRICIYPHYINSKCTVQQGRRIPKELACENPDVLEIKDVLEKSMKLPCELQDKSYSRDFWQRGRLRVTLRKEDGTPLAKEFPTKRAVMVEIARLIPKHPGRVPGSEAAKKRMASPLDVLTQFTSQPGQAGAGAGGSWRRSTKSPPRRARRGASEQARALGTGSI